MTKSFENRPSNPLELLPPSRWDSFKHTDVPFEAMAGVRSRADTYWMASCSLMAYARPQEPDFAIQKFKSAFEQATKSKVEVKAGSGKHGANWYLISCDLFQILVFRGSEIVGSHWDGKQFMQAFKDWFVTDADLDLVEWRFGGRVHDGFSKAYTDVKAEIADELSKRIDVPVFVTGHSLGGGMAVLAGSDLTAHGRNVTVYTFGAPRVGDKDFVMSNSHIPTFRFVNSLDIVPQVPPRSSIFGGSYLHYSTSTHRYSFSLRSSREIVEDDGIEAYIGELSAHEIGDAAGLVSVIFGGNILAETLNLIRPIVDHAPVLYSIAAYNDWLIGAKT
jgi:hypothetical protein